MPSTDNFHRERTFSGELSKDDKCIPVRFQARLDESGDLCAIFEPISFSEDSSFILREWSKDGLTTFFKLTAESEDGVILSSDYLYFNSVGPHFDAERGRHYVLKPQFAQAAVEAKWAGAEASAWLIRYLRGFPCFRPLSHPSAWGTVTMRGVLDPTDLNELTGHVAVESAGFVSNAATWRLEAQKLLDHVRIVMSFAAGALIRSPAEEFRHGDQVAVMIRQCGSTSKAFLPCIEVLDDAAMRTFFEAAIDSFEHDWTHKTLNFPIEWYTMMGGTTYQEVRLVSGMTALETLIDSNLEDRYKTNLDDQDFDELESTLISEVRRFFGGPADSSPVMSSICSKLRELNRVPFRRKLKRVMKHWQVPVPPRYNKMLGEAITARNDIVHRGYYYLPGYEEEQEELWIHVTFVRELLTRIIFSMLGYKGRYISYYGGTRSYVAFPPRKGDPK